MLYIITFFAVWEKFDASSYRFSFSCNRCEQYRVSWLLLYNCRHVCWKTKFSRYFHYAQSTSSAEIRYASTQKNKPHQITHTEEIMVHTHCSLLYCWSATYCCQCFHLFCSQLFKKAEEFLSLPAKIKLKLNTLLYNTSKLSDLLR